MNKPLKPIHCGISIADMDQSIEWYQKVFGFTLVYRQYLEQIQCEVAFLELGGFQVELFRHDRTIPLPLDRREPDKDIQTQGIKHVAYEVENIVTLLEDLRQKEVDVVFGPIRVANMLVAFIRDNSGNLIELIEEQQ